MSNVIIVARCVLGPSLSRLAGEALRDVASRSGHTVRVEYPNPDLLGEELSLDEIRNADVIFTAVGSPVDEERFAGKRLVRVTRSRRVRLG